MGLHFQGRQELGQSLPSLPEVQDPPPHRNWHRHHSVAKATARPHSCRHSGTLTTLTGFQVPIHNHRSFYPLARSSPDDRRNHRVLRSSPHRTMDLQARPSRPHHIRPRESVHFKPLDIYRHHPGPPDTDNNGLQSRGEWDGRETSSHR